MSAPDSNSPEMMVIKGLTGVTGGGFAAAIFVLLTRILPNYLNGTSADAKAMRDEYRSEFARLNADLEKLRSELVSQKEQYEKKISDLRSEHDAEIAKLRSDYECKIAELNGRVDKHTTRYTRVFADRAAARAMVDSLRIQLNLTVDPWPPDPED